MPGSDLSEVNSIYFTIDIVLFRRQSAQWARYFPFVTCDHRADEILTMQKAGDDDTRNMKYHQGEPYIRKELVGFFQ